MGRERKQFKAKQKKEGYKQNQSKQFTKKFIAFQFQKQKKYNIYTYIFKQNTKNNNITNYKYDAMRNYYYYLKKKQTMLMHSKQTYILHICIHMYMYVYIVYTHTHTHTCIHITRI